jgi:N4-gp56 family major capsid protein
MLKGEIGCLGGVRFVESTEAKIWGEAGASNAAVFSTLVLGKNAYGVTEVEGGGLETIVKQKGSAGTADPLDQRASAGWKAIKTAEILSDEFMVRIESSSSFSTAAAN